MSLSICKHNHIKYNLTGKTITICREQQWSYFTAIYNTPHFLQNTIHFFPGELCLKSWAIL